MQLVQLQRDRKEIAEATDGLQIVAITYDEPEVIRTFTDKQKIEIPALADPGSKTIRAYGILKDDVAESSKIYGIPYPGTFVIDREGIVRAKLFLEGYRARHATADLIAAAKSLKAEAAP